MNLPTQPQDVHARLAEAYNSGNVNTVMAMYDFNGILVPQPGKAVSGKAEFEEAVKGILSVTGKMYQNRLLSGCRQSRCWPFRMEHY